MIAETYKIFVHDMRNFSLHMVLSHQYVFMKPRGGKLEEPTGGTTLRWKIFQCLKLFFRPFGTKTNWKWKMTLADPPAPPKKWNFPLFLTLPFWYFFIIFYWLLTSEKCITSDCDMAMQHEYSVQILSLSYCFILWWQCCMIAMIWCSWFANRHTNTSEPPGGRALHFDLASEHIFRLQWVAGHQTVRWVASIELIR